MDIFVLSVLASLVLHHCFQINFRIKLFRYISLLLIGLFLICRHIKAFDWPVVAKRNVKCPETVLENGESHDHEMIDISPPNQALIDITFEMQMARQGLLQRELRLPMPSSTDWYVNKNTL